MEFCLRRTRQLSGLRELPKFYIILALAEMHRQLNAIGIELARSGAIAAADDVYFLEFDEVRVGLRGADLRASSRAATGSTTSNYAGAGFPGSCSPTARTWRRP